MCFVKQDSQGDQSQADAYGTYLSKINYPVLSYWHCHATVGDLIYLSV